MSVSLSLNTPYKTYDSTVFKHLEISEVSVVHRSAISPKYPGCVILVERDWDQIWSEDLSKRATNREHWTFTLITDECTIPLNGEGTTLSSKEVAKYIIDMIDFKGGLGVSSREGKLKGIEFRVLDAGSKGYNVTRLSGPVSLSASTSSSSSPSSSSSSSKSS